MVRINKYLINNKLINILFYIFIVLNLLHESIRLPHNKLQNKISEFHEQSKLNYQDYSSASLNKFVSNRVDSLKAIKVEYCQTNKKRVSYQSYKNDLNDKNLELLSEIPSIDFNDANNIITWTTGREILLNFGSRFKSRLELFISKYFLIYLILNYSFFYYITNN
jgi:hypothetical protein